MKTYTFHVSLPRTGRVWRRVEVQADQTLEDLHFAIQKAFDFDADHLYSFFMSGKAWDESTEYRLPEDSDPWGFSLDDEVDLVTDEASEAGKPGEPGKPGDTGEPGDTDEVSGDEPDLIIPTEQAEQMLRTLLGVGDDVPLEDLRAQIEELQNEFLGEDDEDLPGNVLTTTLEELNLKPKQEFLYLFDYGDEWRFKVRVQAITPDAPEGEYPRVVESVGDAPKQYPDFEEDDEDDE